MKRCVLLFFFAFVAAPTFVFAQLSYIATDSSRHGGIKVIEGTIRDNCRYIKVKINKDSPITTHLPEELDEYGLKDGTVYKSRTIDVDGETRRVFLKQLVEHGVVLYYYESKDHRAFYLESAGSPLVELRKNGDKNYKAILAERLADCGSSKNNVRLVRYKQKELSKLVSDYNSCSSRPFPYMKIGIVAGYGLTGLSLSSNYTGELDKHLKFDNSQDVLLGISLDNPIAASYFSLHADVLLSKSGYSIYNQNKNVDTDVVVNFTSLNFPLQVRYTIPSKKIQPFINAGGVLSFRLKNSSAVYRATVGPNEATINGVSENSLISDSSLGIAAGAGLQLNVNLRNTLSLELRFMKSYNNSDFLSVRQIGLLTSFTF